MKVNAENEAANLEKEKCEQIAVEVTEKQASCEKDLAAALPLVEQVCNAVWYTLFCDSFAVLFMLLRVCRKNYKVNDALGPCTMSIQQTQTHCIVGRGCA